MQNASTGAALIATMNNGSVTGYASPVSNLGSGWSIVASGNILANGASDLVLQRQSDGQIVYADETGGHFNKYVFVANAGAFTVGGVGDINRDGYSDIVLQNHQTGEVAYINMAGGQSQGQSSIVTLSGWNVVGVGDVNGDGYADIVAQRQSDGQTVYANMAGGVFNGLNFVANAAGYTAVGVADVNGNGSADIVFQSNNGMGSNVFADVHTGTTQFGTATAGFNSVDWQIKGFGDFNGDGFTDIVVQQVSTGIALTAVEGANGYAGWGTAFGGLHDWIVIH
jgi:hypothetical protein